MFRSISDSSREAPIHRSLEGGQSSGTHQELVTGTHHVQVRCHMCTDFAAEVDRWLMNHAETVRTDSDSSKR